MIHVKLLIHMNLEIDPPSVDAFVVSERGLAPVTGLTAVDWHS